MITKNKIAILTKRESRILLKILKQEPEEVKPAKDWGHHQGVGKVLMRKLHTIGIIQKGSKWGGVKY